MPPYIIIWCPESDIDQDHSLHASWIFKVLWSLTVWQFRQVLHRHMCTSHCFLVEQEEFYGFSVFSYPLSNQYSRIWSLYINVFLPAWGFSTAPWALNCCLHYISVTMKGTSEWKSSTLCLAYSPTSKSISVSLSSWHSQNMQCNKKNLTSCQQP